jgi:hypothetical protein
MTTRKSIWLAPKTSIFAADPYFQPKRKDKTAKPKDAEVIAFRNKSGHGAAPVRLPGTQAFLIAKGDAI